MWIRRFSEDFAIISMILLFIEHHTFESGGCSSVSIIYLRENVSNVYKGL